MHVLINWHSCRKVSFYDGAAELLGKKVLICTRWTNDLISDQSKEVWMLPKHELFRMAWVSCHTARLAWCQEPSCQWDWKFLKHYHGPKAGRVPQTKASHRVQQLACNGAICFTILSCCNTGAVLSAPACCTAVSPGAVLSLFSLFYYFSGNSNQCYHAWCTGWKMESPSPSSFNLMNCLFPYQRVMSTKPRHIYSRNKRHRNGGGAGSRNSSWVWRGAKLDILKACLTLNPTDTRFRF